MNSGTQLVQRDTYIKTRNMADIEQLILSAVAKNDSINDTWDFALQHNLDHQQVIGTMKSLLTDFYVIEEPLSTSYWSLTTEGEQIASNGSVEFKLYESILNSGDAGISVQTLQETMGDLLKIAMGQCMKNKWIKKHGENLIAIAGTIKDEVAENLRKIKSGESAVSEEELNNLKRRKLVQQINRKSAKVLKGPEFREFRVRKVADLTKDMLGTRNEVIKSF